MPAILELPELRKRVVRWTVDAYINLVEQGLSPKKGELIRGIIIEKMSKSGLHIYLVKMLYDLLLRLAPEGTSVFQEGPLRLIDSVPEPDIMIVPGALRDLNYGIPQQALLVIEVALSSVLGDREYASMYAEGGVPEYWIVLAEAKEVEVYRSPLEGIYQERKTYGVGEVVVCQGLPRVKIVLAELFA